MRPGLASRVSTVHCPARKESHTVVATESHLTTGDEIAGYTLESLVGRGGMGEVFRAVDGHLARAVALKVLAPGLVHDEASRDRILRESQLAASLDHPNVIPVYAAGEADGHVYIAMRLVEGSDLRTTLRRDGRLDPARAIALRRAGGLRARCRARARSGAPRRQAEQRAYRRAAGARALLPRRLRHHDDRRAICSRSMSRSACSGHSPTSRPSRCAATRSMHGRTSTRSDACSSSASPARFRSSATRTSRSCSPTSRSPRRGPASGSASCRPRSTR